MPSCNDAPEKYSSYKKRFFNKYKERIKALITGVDSLSLKNTDKLKLKKQMAEILNENNNILTLASLVSKRFIINDKDACKCKPKQRICYPPRKGNIDKIKECSNCGKPLPTRLQN